MRDRPNMGAFPDDHTVDYYKILGVSQNATRREIVAAFYALARKYHPDTASEPDPESRRFKELYEAYRVLSDPKLRRQYDRRRQGRSPRSIPVTVVPTEPAGRREAAFSSTERTRRWDLWFDLPVRPEEAWYGVRCELKVRRQVDCRYCRHPGSTCGPEASACEHCQAAGRDWETVRLWVNVPGGVRTGSVITVRGYGHQYPGRPQWGDLMLRIVVRPSW